MKTTVILDDELVERAKQIKGTNKTSTALNEALKDLIQRDNALRLAALGGTVPDLADVSRRSFG